MVASFFAIHTTDSDIQARGQLLKGLALCLGLGALLDIPLLLTDPHGSLRLVLAAICIVLMSILTFGLAHRGSVTLGSWLLSGTVFLVLPFAVAPHDLFTRPVTLTFLFPMLIAGIINGARGPVIFGTLTLVLFISLLISRQVQFSPWELVAIVLIAVLTGMIGLVIHTLERARDIARGQAQAAQEAQAAIIARQSDLRIANAELTDANEKMARLIAVIHDLETPVIPLMDGVLVAPLVGSIDAQRAERLLITVLDAVSHTHAHTLLVDLTGVPLIDTAVTQQLHNLAIGVRLLGAAVIVTGISPAIAQSMVHLGVDFDTITTMGRLEDGVQHIVSQRSSNRHTR